MSGNGLIVSVTLGPDVYWDQLLVDGTSVWSGSGNCPWNSTAVANGNHTLLVRVFQQGGTSPIGSASISVTVKNSTANSTPFLRRHPTLSTPSLHQRRPRRPRSRPQAPRLSRPDPYACAHAQPGNGTTHFSTLGYRATLPSEAQCTAWTNARPIPENAPIELGPSTYRPVAFRRRSIPIRRRQQRRRDPGFGLCNVTGNYTGTTDEIVRWAACKWGIDEDVVRAQGHN